MRKLLILSITCAAPLAAQAPAVKLIAAPDAQTKPVFGIVTAIRQLPNGSVLVNDIQKRQLTLLDQSLGGANVIADSSASATNSYGIRGGGLIPYLGDSTLFVDPAALSMFVLDPAGKIARVASVPRSQDANSIGTNTISNPGLDAKGRLVYRAVGFNIRPPAPAPGGRGGNTPFAFPEPPDSAALVRVDLVSRKLDTAAFFKIPKIKMETKQNENGGITMQSLQNPMPLVDDWAMLADGSIAVVRGQDYHVDFVNADGSISSGTKVPFDWQRLDDEAKVAVIDSATKAAEALRAAMAKAAAEGGPNPLAAMGGAPGGAPMVVMSMGVGGGRGDAGGGGMAQRMMGSGGPTISAPSFIPANELPDYRPAFGNGAARGDADGNVWVRTSAVRQGAAGAIYDVINRRGELIERIQIPAGRQIVGFGKGGIVYMTARDNSGTWIERTHR
jgi:hypothetical protein